MEPTIKILVYVHAGFGGIALVAGLVAILAKKGLALHKTSGRIFYFSMLLSAILAMFVAVLPNHESPFLFAVGIFSLYFILAGKRALLFKNQKTNLKIDILIARLMIISGLLMILLPLLISKNLNIVLCVFAVVGISFAIRDLILYKQPEKLRQNWLKLHLGKMLGAYICATTAFVVVNEFFSNLYGWFVPGILGGFFIIYWIRKLNKKTLAQ